MPPIFSDQEIARIVEFGEGEGLAELLLAAPVHVAADLGIHIMRIASALVLITTKIDLVLFNRVIGLGIKEPATEAIVDEIVVAYRNAGIRNFAVQVSPTAQPPDLSTWLETRGLFYRKNTTNKVYRGVAPPPVIPTELRIECIGPKHAGAFASVAVTAFGWPNELRPVLEAGVGRPGWRHYLGWDSDVAVATGALFVRDQVGWLAAGCTLPSHRRRGAQGAIMVQRIRHGIEMGCQWLISEAGESSPSYRNMLRTGFVLAYKRPSYMHRMPITTRSKVLAWVVSSFFSMRPNRRNNLNNGMP
jgi:hypothetical protein